MSAAANEVVVQLGAARHLAAVVSLPAGAAKPRAGVVLPNAGVIHRVGPHRLTVKLARTLAERGYAVVRLDLSGLGDSAMPADGLHYADQSVLDIEAATTYLASATGVERFVVAGICSGAQNAFNAARSDPRVVGAWMMDQFYFPTRWTLPHYLRRKLTHEPVGEAVRRRVRALPARVYRYAARRLRRDEPDLDEPLPEGDPVFEESDFSSGLAELAGRRTKMCFVYSGSHLDQYSYPEQLRDRFGGAVSFDDVDVHFLPEIDHTLTTLESQRLLVAQIARWCDDVTRG